MVTDQVIANCIEEVKEIAKIDLCIVDAFCNEVARTGPIEGLDKGTLQEFAAGDATSMEKSGLIYIRICDDNETSYLLVSTGKDGDFTEGRLAAVQIKNLIIAYRDRVDRNSFFQNLLLDNMLPVDIYNKARKLHIEASLRRCVFVIEPVVKKENNLMEMVKELFYTEAGDHITAVDENKVVVIRVIDENENEESLQETADMLVDMAGSEAMSDVRVAYGTITDDIRGIPRSYKEAKMALEVSKIFYPLKRTIEYQTLGVGRLIYQLPVNLCQLFIKEIFGDNVPEEIDEEVLTTVNKFFDNNLNVSETSRQLFIHRNTLIYRLEKIQKATGLDVRVFDDALTLKIALMVVNYLKYREDLQD